MTYYLGLAIGDARPSACLIEDNKIVAIGEEEKLLGFKYAFDQQPIQSVGYCLKQANIKLKDVDKVAVNWNPKLFIKKFYKYRFKYNLFSYLGIRGRIKDLERALKIQYGAEKTIEPLEHHITHVYSSIPLSGFKKCRCISVDGTGENVTTLIYDSKEGKIKEFYRPTSLGLLYAAATTWLGFGKNQEGKTMGLASYGTKRYDLSKYVSYGNGGYRSAFDLGELYEKFVEDFGDRRRGEIEKKHEDFAFSVQKQVEDVMLHLVDYYAEENGNLCLSGGVALNCVMNGRVLQESKIKDIFIQPMAADDGGALGAAVYLAVQDGNKFDKMIHPYYGPEFSDEEIEKLLKQAKVDYQRHKDPAGLAAELLAEGNIIGWFQGRLEVGPRALGDRSILADPRRAEMKDIINKRVKHREPFRPFAPSLLEEEMDKYLEDAYPAPFMLLSFDVRKDKQKEIPAVTHVDGTARPQTVTKEQNPLYYELIKQFKKETGVPVILNTSFNVGGKPIVCTPKDALSAFYSEGMDALVMGSYVIKK